MIYKKNKNLINKNSGAIATKGDLQIIKTLNSCNNAINSSIKFITDWINRNNMRRELNTMPDYLLSDIGLQRDQINGIVSGKILRDTLNKSVTNDQLSGTIFNEQDDKPIAA